MVASFVGSFRDIDSSVLVMATTCFVSFCVIREMFDTENGNTGNFHYAVSLLKSSYQLKSHLVQVPSHESPFSGLARSTRSVAFPLSSSESGTVFPLTTRLTLHLFCR